MGLRTPQKLGGWGGPSLPDGCAVPWGGARWAHFTREVGATFSLTQRGDKERMSAVYGAGGTASSLAAGRTVRVGRRGGWAILTRTSDPSWFSGLTRYPRWGQDLGGMMLPIATVSLVRTCTLVVCASVVRFVINIAARRWHIKGTSSSRTQHSSSTIPQRLKRF